MAQNRIFFICIEFVGFRNGYQKDKIRKSVTNTKLYYPNGKIMEKGQSKLDISDAERHWYYFGDWKYFGENGNLKYIKRYADGKKIDSISFLK